MRVRDVLGDVTFLEETSPSSQAARDFTFATPKLVLKKAKSPAVALENAENDASNAEVQTEHSSSPAACDTPPLMLLRTPNAAVLPEPSPKPAPAPVTHLSLLPHAQVVPAEPVIAAPEEAVAAPAPAESAKEVTVARPEEPVEQAPPPSPEQCAAVQQPVSVKPAPRTGGRRRGGARGGDTPTTVATLASPPPQSAVPAITPARVTRSSVRAAAAAAVTSTVKAPGAETSETDAVPAKTVNTPAASGRASRKAQRMLIPASSDEAQVPVGSDNAALDPYSEAALAALMANPKAAFAAGPRAVQNSPVSTRGRTPRVAARKKTAEERHAAEWSEDA